MSSQPPPKPDDCVAWITLRLHANGGLSIQGTIGDRRTAHRILDEAKAAITRQIPEDRAIVVPNRDVDVTAYDGLRELGDIPRSQHGDS